MDGQRFDDIAKRLATGTSRRAVLKGMVGGLVTGLVGSREAGAAPPCAGNGQACGPGRPCCGALACGANGVCGPAPGGGCAAGLTRCSGTCIDTHSDPLNCGACGATCPAERPYCDASVCYQCRSSLDCAGNPAAPICHRGTCVQCADNPDCPADRPLCDLLHGHVCLECYDDRGCPSDRPACLAGTCVECLADGDCPADYAPFCHQGRCVPCAGDFHCPPDQYCVNETCRACRDAADCPAERPYCSAGACRQCLSSLDCAGNPAAPICDHRGTCVQCRDAADCSDPTRPICDGLRGHVCVECYDDAGCPTDRPACFAGTCVECLAYGDCPAERPTCFNNACIACVDDTDCPDASTPVCLEGTCIQCVTDPHCQEATLGVFPLCIDQVCLECRDGEDCPAERPYCSDNLCYECLGNGDCPTTSPVCVAGRCEECVTDPDCQTAQLGLYPYCLDNTCVECFDNTECPAERPACLENFCQPCRTNADCSGSTPVCLDGTCIQCLDDADCQTATLGVFPYCVDQVCLECQTSDQCPAGEACTAGTCQAETCPGEGCCADADCPAGEACVDGTCRQTCAFDGDCPACAVCDTGTGYCTPVDCGDPCLVCDPTNGGQCRVLDCPAGLFCHAGACTECTWFGDCVNARGQGYYCDNGTCVLGSCRNNADCQAECYEYCDPEIGQCVNYQCIYPGTVCVNGSCPCPDDRPTLCWNSGGDWCHPLGTDCCADGGTCPQGTVCCNGYDEAGQPSSHVCCSASIVATDTYCCNFVDGQPISPVCVYDGPTCAAQAG